MAISNRSFKLLIQFILGISFVATIGAICIHYYLEALLRSVAKRPLGDMRALGSALETYRRVNGTYPLISPRQPAQALVPYLVPTYLSAVPDNDGWGQPFLIVTSKDHYEIWSLGRDGKDGPNTTDGPTDTWECDVLFKDGLFLRYPRSVVRR